MVSALSVGLAGSKITRLLRHGIAGHTVEMVGVSWIAKPWDRSSRSMMLSDPPDLGVWAAAGPGQRRRPAPARAIRAETNRIRFMPSPSVMRRGLGGRPESNLEGKPRLGRNDSSTAPTIGERRPGDNPSRARLT